MAQPVMDYYIRKIGPYPFDKLANVQSKTLFGGMENAGAIFYAERSVTGTGSNESLIAHEIAHQWFGDGVTELNWHHVWLSEGFATYFTNLWFEEMHGAASFVQRLTSERKRCLDYERRSLTPVIDTTVIDYLKLLNTNSYQKGSWVLHMLRRQVGDELFFKGIRRFYEEYKYGNALTEDFQKVMDEVSGQDLGLFFRQWLYSAGHPKLDIKWKNSKGYVELETTQVQSGTTFVFPLDIRIKYEDGSDSVETFMIEDRSTTKSIKSAKKAISIEPDPYTWLLFEINSIVMN